MAKIKYDINIMKYISLFESLTGTKLKDCIADEKLLFVVQEGQIGRAIGKEGINVRKLNNILKKDIRIVEYSGDVLQFVQNMIYPLKVKAIEEIEGKITITGNDTKTKGMIIGRDSKNLNFLKDVVKRYFNIQEIKVV
jgi:N utilization substance protein A